MTVVAKNPERAQLTQMGARIREFRETSGLSLHELALLSGISAPALSLIETGKRDLRITSLYRIANALRIPANHLLEHREAPLQKNEPRIGRGYDLGDYR
jgi:transcriptional regulator with XRE-family HTH domain